MERFERKLDAPLVSYVTVVRNAVTTLPRCLESVRLQSYPHVEHVVVDGVSSDGTLDVVRGHAGRLDYYVSEPDDGVYDAMNKALTLASGDYICVLNADDWLEPEAASLAVQHLDGMPEKAVLLSAVYRHRRRGEGESVRLWLPELLHPGFLFAPGRWCHNGLYATRGLCEASGLFDCRYRIVADYKWLARCLDVGGRCVYTTEPTMHFMEGGLSGDGVASALERMQVQREAYPCLSEEEAAALCWCLTDSLPEIMPVPPQNATRTLRDMLCRHADDPCFVNALAWAMAAVCIHPADIPLSLRKRVSRGMRSLWRGVAARFNPS